MEGSEPAVALLSDESAAAVALAAHHARSKHGPLTTDPVRSCSILIRECGEAIDEALMATSGKVPDGMAVGLHETMENVRRRFRDQCIKNLYNELAQVAAVAMVIMRQIEDRRINGQS